MQIFPRTNRLSDRQIGRETRDEQIRTARVFEGYMKYSGIFLNYVDVPSKRPFGPRSIALARIAISLPPEGKSDREQMYALTEGGLFGRVEPTEGDNPFIAFRFPRQPVPLSSALGDRVGSTGMTVGEIMQANIDAARLQALENARFHSPIAATMEQTPLTVPMPLLVPTEVNPLLVAA